MSMNELLLKREIENKTSENQIQVVCSLSEGEVKGRA